MLDYKIPSDICLDESGTTIITDFQVILYSRPNAHKSQIGTHKHA